ncbi:MAG TPA: isoprenylcysteine carboxylmethyltransferase family protein [Gemmatimonadaceae bacterium]
MSQERPGAPVVGGVTPSVARPNAGVSFPPPLVYAGGLAIAWGLERWRSWPIVAGAGRMRLVPVALFAIAYCALFGTALAAFRRARTTIVPNRPAAAVVTTGPYRWTRNPMYVSLVCLYAAGAAWLDSWWGLLVLPLVVLGIDRVVIAREERYLATAFPGEYAAYRARVRRWL